MHEQGCFGHQMINIDSRLLLLGGTDPNGNVYSTVYQYDQQFGFFDTKITLQSPRYNFVAFKLLSDS